MEESVQVPIAQESQPQYASAPQDEDLQKLWNEFLQKCCEAGQLQFHLDRIEGQKRKLEKDLEVTQGAVKKAANKYDELKIEKLKKEQPKEPVTQ